MKFFSITLIFFLLFFNATGQYQNVMISNEDFPEEPSITMNPRNPDQLVAGANLNNYYVSNDGGYSWTRGPLVSQQYNV
ncbi:MAG: hypothetical protein DRJ02_10140, partial [Bacteroidetes bacterium]